MNRELLLKVADQIDNIPESFDLSVWADASYEEACDTVGCVAGWAAMLHDPMLRIAVAERPSDLEGFNWEKVAYTALEIDERQADVLFCSNRWWVRQMKRYGFRPTDDDGVTVEQFDEQFDEDDYVPLDAVPAKAAVVALRALAAGEINLDGVLADDEGE